MVNIRTLLLVLQLSGTSIAALTPCMKDTCFKAVAENAGDKPDLASRRADCRAVLRTVIDDDVTVTVTNIQTLITNTIIITSTDDTITRTTQPATVTKYQKREQKPQATGIQLSLKNLLEERDKIIVGGLPPSYARTACEDTQRYAIACLCFGVRAQVNKVAIRTITVTETISTSTITTTFVKTTTTLTQPTPTQTVLPRGPTCDAPGEVDPGLGGCSSECYCDPRGNGLGICNAVEEGASCAQPCQNDGDCPSDQACAIGGGFEGCATGSSCVPYAGCTTTYVPPRKRALYDLSQIFSRSRFRRGHENST